MEQNVKQFIEFFAKYNPYFTSTQKVGQSYCCLNEFGNDPFNNCAFVLDNTQPITEIEKYFAKNNKPCVIYNIDTPDSTYNNHLQKYVLDCEYNDVWLSANVENLIKKFKILKCTKDISIRQIAKSEYDIVCKVADSGFSAEGEDNPYANQDLKEYGKALFGNMDKKWLKIFAIQYKEKYVGTFNLCMNNGICYICGFTIIPEYRRTKILLSLKLMLDILKNEDIKTIFCITEKGAYPHKLYKNIGFKELFEAQLYKQKI